MRETEMFIRANQAFSDIVVQIEDDQWGEMVPSTPDWTIRELVNHVAHNNLCITEGKSLGTEDGSDALGDDPIETWSEIAEAAEEIAEYADSSKAQFYGAQTSDRLLHLWDLSGALGLNQTMNPKLAEFVYDFMLPNIDAISASGAFGPAINVSDDASVEAKLLGLTGRDPELAEEDSF
jgi:uncharacterized protein (TIGR03086 family)